MVRASFVRSFVRSFVVGSLLVGPFVLTQACDDPPPPDVVITPRPSEFDSITTTAAVGTLPGSAEVTSDGTFAYTIPIELPPGRAGMEPSLSIAYDSSGGETALGVGFTLHGLSALSRCPRNPAQDGERRGISFTSDDRLCLDGMRLVAEAGAYGAPGTIYRTEIDELVRVEHIGEGEDGVVGASSFRVRYPDGREGTWIARDARRAQDGRSRLRFASAAPMSRPIALGMIRGSRSGRIRIQSATTWENGSPCLCAVCATEAICA